jgi:Zn-dependent M28 family amino/carboxypeptidase
MLETLLAQVSVDRIRSHIRWLEGVRHPTAAPQALERAAAYIQASLEALPYKVTVHPFLDEGHEFHNILAARRGVGHPEERWLIVAHYDTVAESPGADDNASAVAVLLELATVLAPLTFDRTVQYVAVNLEEKQREGPLRETALLGSRALAAHAAEQGWQIGGAIVLESVAYAGKEIAQQTPEGFPLELPEAGDFAGVLGNEASRDLVGMFLQAVEVHQIELPVVSLVVPGKGEMLPDASRSDHASFWERGYKAIVLTDMANYRNPHYHQPTDTLETLNVPFAAQVCRAVAAMVVAAAG